MSVAKTPGCARLPVGCAAFVKHLYTCTTASLLPRDGVSAQAMLARAQAIIQRLVNDQASMLGWGAHPWLRVSDKYSWMDS